LAIAHLGASKPLQQIKVLRIDKIIYPLFIEYLPTCLPFLPEYLPYLVRLLTEDIKEKGPRNEKGVLFL